MTDRCYLIFGKIIFLENQSYRAGMSRATALMTFASAPTRMRGLFLSMPLIITAAAS